MEGVHYLRSTERMLGSYCVSSLRVILSAAAAHILTYTSLYSYIFFPETANLSLEDVDHLFEKGGITGGVWGAPGGRTVIAHSDRLAGANATKSERDEEKADGAGGQVKHVERHSGSMSDILEKR